MLEWFLQEDYVATGWVIKQQSTVHSSLLHQLRERDRRYLLNTVHKVQFSFNFIFKVVLEYYKQILEQKIALQHSFNLYYVIITVIHQLDQKDIYNYGKSTANQVHNGDTVMISPQNSCYIIHTYSGLKHYGPSYARSSQNGGYHFSRYKDEYILDN